MRAIQWYRWFVKLSYGFSVAGERKIRGFYFNKTFSLQIHSFASGVVVNVERIEGPKSCGERSGQTDRWNRDLSVGGKRPNLALAF